MSAPSAPTFDATGRLPIVSKTSLIFYWVGSTGSPTHYILSSPQDPSSPYTIAAPRSSYEVSGLTQGRSYSYFINASNANGLSASTSYQTVQPGLPPNPPINATVTSVDPTKCFLYWNSATAQDNCTIRGYAVNGQSTIPLSVDSYRTAVPLSYNTQPTALYMNATTDPGYSPNAFVPFINNNYILRFAPSMFQSTTQTLTDYTSTLTYSSIGAGRGIAATNLLMSFNNANYLQGPTPLSYVLSSYTITTWLQQPGLTSNTTGNILGDTNNSNYMNLPAGPILGNYLFYPSSVGVCDGTPGGAGSNGGGGGGGGFGGGGGGAGYVGTSNGLMNGYGGGGGGSYTQGGIIYPGNQTTPGNTGNPNYIAGFANQTSSGLIVLNFFSNSISNAPNFVVSNLTGLLTDVLSSFTIPANTTSITANLWGAGGARGTGGSAGGAGASVVQSFSTTFQTALAYYQGGGGRGAVGGSGNLGAGGAGGDASYIVVNGQITAIAGGGGGGGAIATQSQANGFNPGGGAGSQNAPTSPNIIDYGGQAGCNGVTMGYISSGVHLNIGSNLILGTGGAGSLGVGGGGGGFGGGASLRTSATVNGGAGGGSFTIGGTIFPGVSSIAGNCNSSKYNPSYAVGTSLTNSPTSGFAVLSFFNSSGAATGPDAQFTTAGLATATVPANTTSITAYLWGAGGGGGAFASVPATVGGGGACVVQTFNYSPGNTVTILIGQGNIPISVSSLGGGVSSSGGASALFYNNSCIAIAGGGGSAYNNNAMGGSQTYNLSNNTAFAGSNGLGGLIVGQTATGSPGINSIIKNGGINLNTGWTNVALVASTNTFALYSNGTQVSTNFTALPYYYLPSTSQVFQIGNGFNGNIGETTVYPRAFTAQEVLSNFTASAYYYAAIGSYCNIWNAGQITVVDNQTITQPILQADWSGNWAVSQASLSPPYYLSCQFSGNNMFSGITSNVTPASLTNFTGLQFGINYNTNSINIHESGASPVFTLAGSFNSSNVFMINCTTSNVSYLINSSTFYTSFNLPPVVPYYAAIGLSNAANTVSNINFVSLSYWNTNRLLAVNNQTLTQPTQGPMSWAVSQRSFVSPYASCQFNGSNMFFGVTTSILSNFTTAAQPQNLLQFGIQFSTATSVNVYESGNIPFTLTGSFSAATVFRINCTTSNVTYLSNDTIFYTSALAPQLNTPYYTAVGIANQFNTCSNIQLGSLYGSFFFTGGAFMSLVNNTRLPFFNQAYTIEAWINISSFSEAAICAWGGFTGTDTINFKVTATGVNGLNNSWTNNDLSNTATNLNNRFWHHVVAQYNGSSVTPIRTIYLDGALLATATPNPPTNNVEAYANFTVGRANGTNNFNGLITNLRIANRVVYTGSYIVPTAPLTATQASNTNINALGPGQTVLLLNATQNNPYQDTSGYGYTMTPSGMSISSNSPFTFTY